MDAIEERIEIFSKFAGSLITTASNIKCEQDKLRSKNEKLLQECEKTEKELNVLKKRIRKLNITRILLVSVGIIIAAAITLFIMYLIKYFDLKGIEILYGMVGFTVFFAIIAVSFTIITEIKLGYKNIAVSGPPNESK